MNISQKVWYIDKLGTSMLESPVYQLSPLTSFSPMLFKAACKKCISRIVEPNRSAFLPPTQSKIDHDYETSLWFLSDKKIGETFFLLIIWLTFKIKFYIKKYTAVFSQRWVDHWRITQVHSHVSLRKIVKIHSITLIIYNGSESTIQPKIMNENRTTK